MSMVGRGGNPPRRLDQQRAYPPAGVQPGSQSGVVRARVVIVSGAGEGVFIYSGVPGPGNAPVEYITAPGVTADPFGNPLPATGGGFTSVRYFSGTAQAVASLNSGELLLYQGPPAGYSSGASLSVSSADDRSLDLFSASISPFDVAAFLRLTTQQFGSAVPPYVLVGNATTLLVANAGPPISPARAEVQGSVAFITSRGGKIWLPSSGDTTGATDFAAIGAAVALSQDVELLPGTFFIPNGSTIDLRKTGLKFNGAGPRATIIQVQGGSSNAPAMMVAGEGQDIGGFRIGYNSQQPLANTLAAAFQFGDDTVGNCFMSHFHDMEWFQGAYGTVINPNLTATGGFFSCELSNISVRGWSISGIFWNSAAGTGASSCTGSVINNMYVNNNPAGTKQSSLTYGIDIRNFDEIVFNQLNLENSTIDSTDWFNFQSSAPSAPFNVIINSLHCEELTLAGSSGNAGMFHVGDGISLIVNGMSVFFATLNGTVWNPVVRFFGTGSNVTINGYSEGTSNAFGGASSLIHQWATYNLSDCALNVTDVTEATLISTLASGLPVAGCYAYVQWPGSGTDGASWLALGAPVAGWTVSGVAQYRLLPDGTVLVMITDLVLPGAPPVNGTVIFTAAHGLPPGYAPATATRVPCVAAGGGGIGGAIPALEFETNGSVQVFGVGGTTLTRLDCADTVLSTV